MKSTQTIYNPELDIVTLPKKEYDKLLGYKQLCKEFQSVLKGDSE